MFMVNSIGPVSSLSHSSRYSKLEKTGIRSINFISVIDQPRETLRDTEMGYIPVVYSALEAFILLPTASL